MFDAFQKFHLLGNVSLNDISAVNACRSHCKSKFEAEMELSDAFEAMDVDHVASEATSTTGRGFSPGRPEPFQIVHESVEPSCRLILSNRNRLNALSRQGSDSLQVRVNFPAANRSFPRHRRSLSILVFLISGSLTSVSFMLHRTWRLGLEFATRFLSHFRATRCVHGVKLFPTFQTLSFLD